MAVNHYQKAFGAWPVLVERAETQATIYYSELAELIGIYHRAVTHVLSVIQQYCLDEGLPPLTILVVNKKHKAPGPGFIAWQFDNLEEGFETVYRYDWSQVLNPFDFAQDGTTPDDLIQKLLEEPEKSGEVYGIVKQRGVAQRLFREALLAAYDGCAFCGCTFLVALEASHIVPWSLASHDERLDPRNGLLLCATHHKFFDNELITLANDYKIEYFDPDGVEDDLSPADQQLTTDLHGRPANLPDDSKLRPLLKYIERHNERMG